MCPKKVKNIQICTKKSDKYPKGQQKMPKRYPNEHQINVQKISKGYLKVHQKNIQKSFQRGAKRRPESI